jgi:hypothetical protein
MSLFENLTGCETYVAGADLSTKQYYFVKLNSSGQIVLAGVGDQAIGVLFDKPVSGAVGAVKPLDCRKSLITANGVIAKGAYIAADAAGKAKVATTGATTSSNVLGIAIEAAAADLDIIQFVAIPFGAVPTTNA